MVTAALISRDCRLQPGPDPFVQLGGGGLGETED